QPGQAADGQLHGEGDLPLDLLRPQAGGDGINLDLDGGRVGEGVDVELGHRPGAEADEQARPQQDEEAVSQGPVDDGVEHVRPWSVVRGPLSVVGRSSGNGPRTTDRLLCQSSPPPMRSLSISDFRMKLPFVATLSPGRTGAKKACSAGRAAAAG